MSGLRRIRGSGLVLGLVVACWCSSARSVCAQAESGGGGLPEQSVGALAEQLMQILTQTGVQLPGAPGSAPAGDGQGASPANPMGVANPSSWQLTPEQRGNNKVNPTGVANPSSWQLTPEQRGYRSPPLEGAAGSAASAGSEVPTAKPSAKLPPQTIYRWRDRHGRIYYTNIAEQIPESQRARARVDLSYITLNTELGNELNRRLEQRYEKLASQPKCAELRKAAELGFLERLWADYAPLVVCGGLLLLFVLFTPRALRQFGGPAWSRTLMMAIPALALSGVLLFSMRETNLAVIEMKHRAAPCEQSTFDGMGTTPDAVLRRAALVRQLQGMVTPTVNPALIATPAAAKPQGAP